MLQTLSPEFKYCQSDDETRLVKLHHGKTLARTVQTSASSAMFVYTVVSEFFFPRCDLSQAARSAL